MGPIRRAQKQVSSVQTEVQPKRSCVLEIDETQGEVEGSEYGSDGKLGRVC